MLPQSTTFFFFFFLEIDRVLGINRAPNFDQPWIPPGCGLGALLTVIHHKCLVLCEGMPTSLVREQRQIAGYSISLHQNSVGMTIMGHKTSCIKYNIH